MQLKEGERSVEVCVNGYLKEQRGLISKVVNLEIHATAQIILSAPSNSSDAFPSFYYFPYYYNSFDLDLKN